MDSDLSSLYARGFMGARTTMSHLHRVGAIAHKTVYSHKKKMNETRDMSAPLRDVCAVSLVGDANRLVVR